MQSLPFSKPHVPGVHTLWILKFRNEPQQETRPAVDFFIPSPFKKNEWINASPGENAKAQAILDKIQTTCEEIKKECKDTDKLETLEQYIQKTKVLFKDLKNLDELVKSFNDFMHQFRSHPKEGEK